MGGAGAYPPAGSTPRRSYPPQQAPPPQAPAGGGYDQVLAQLKDLGDLKAQGVLSEAEFETQKRRILGG